MFFIYLKKRPLFEKKEMKVEGRKGGRKKGGKEGRKSPFFAHANLLISSQDKCKLLK
jgi:hypothetical protein